MPDELLSLFLAALERLLAAAREYPIYATDLANVESLFAEVQIAASAAGGSVPPLVLSDWHLYVEHRGMTSTDGGETWHMESYYTPLWMGSRELRMRWVSRVEAVADAVRRQIEAREKAKEETPPVIGGVIPPDAFVWDGVKVDGFSPDQFRLLACLTAGGQLRSVPIQTVVENVYSNKPHLPEDPARAIQVRLGRLQKKLDETRAGILISLINGYVQAEEIGQKKREK